MKKVINYKTLSPPKLIVPKSEALKNIKLQIKKGKKLLTINISNTVELIKLEYEVSKWHLFNKELLTRCFDSYRFTEDYEEQIDFHYYKVRDWVYRYSDSDLGKERINSYINSIIVALESFRDRLRIIPEQKDGYNKNKVMQADKPGMMNELESNNIFIVHGHDKLIKESVARYLQKLNLNPIILHEQPDQGRTIIEKFEKYSNVGFAIVLLTPDDLGKVRDSQEEAKLRARQNVIFELGFFIGKLGRKRVCAIYNEGVELPSDLLGILYIPFDNEGGWKLRLAKEIKHAKIKIDLDKVV